MKRERLTIDAAEAKRSRDFAGVLGFAFGGVVGMLIFAFIASGVCQ